MWIYANNMKKEYKLSLLIAFVLILVLLPLTKCNADTDKVEVKEKKVEETVKYEMPHGEKVVESNIPKPIMKEDLEEIVEERSKKKVEVKKEILKEKQASSKNKSEWMTFHATYYGSDCYKCSGISASGIDLRKSIYHKGYRIIATDPSVIPMWSIVEIKTPNETFKAVALDTGSKIKQKSVDILVESEKVSSQYGRHNVQLRIIGKIK